MPQSTSDDTLLKYFRRFSGPKCLPFLLKSSVLSAGLCSLPLKGQASDLQKAGGKTLPPKPNIEIG